MRLFYSYIFLLAFSANVFAQQNGSPAIVSSEISITGKASCMLFSKNGFYYTATSEGLFLFDGTKLLPLSKKSDSIPLISTLAENSLGHLWIGCVNGSVFIYRNKKFHSWQPAEGLPKAVISSIAFDALNTPWISTKGEGVYVFYQDRLYNFNTDDGLSDNYVYQVLFQNNQMIAATDQGISICYFDGKKKSIKSFTASDGLSDNIVQALANDTSSGNLIWLGFENGCLGTFNLNTFQYNKIYCGKAGVQQILVLENEIWLAIADGIITLNRTGLNEKQFIPSTGLIQLSNDAEANVWLLKNSSIYRTSGEQLQAVIQLEHDETEDVHDILVSSSGQVWLTAKSGITVYQPGQSGVQKKSLRLPLHPNSEVTCLQEDAAGNIWIGTMGDGIFIVNSSSFNTQHYNAISELGKGSILSITEKKGTIWIASLEGVWQISTDTRKFEQLNTTSISGSTYIYYVMEDSQGRVWFATDGKGVVMWQNGTYKTFREKEGLQAKVIYAITEDKNGFIWCNTLNNGIYKYDGKQFRHFGVNEGLRDLNISSMVTDASGNIFCVAATQCFIIDVTTETVFSLNSTTFSGNLNVNLNSSFANAKGRFFHAGNHIYSWVRPGYQKVIQPQTRILAVSLFLDELDMNQNSFAYNENNLSFRFAGFYYSNPNSIEYQYKLEGYNQEWQTTKDGFVNFPKLSPASYQFRVRSSVTGNFQNATEEAYSFTIQKPFWKQWWFLLLSISAVTAVIISIIKVREKELQKMQQLQTEKLQSQYETLKNQVNPHFLFNSFNTLLTVIEEDPSKASGYVEHLSDFYRSIVNLREKDLIPLKDELKIIDHYFFIQKKRFGDALLYHNNIKEDAQINYLVPPLTLQMLVENAIKHNIVSKGSPLTLSLKVENDFLEVQNNVTQKLHSEKSEGLGLQNIKNRFQLIASKDVLIEQTNEYFLVKLPLIKSK